MTRIALYILCGAALGAATVVACGDGSTNHADAATCDCPAAEPPLAGRIVHSAEQTIPLPANGSGTQEANCGSPSAVLLSGSCRLDSDNPGVTLSESGFNAGGPGVTWRCAWNNPTATAQTGRVEVVCLNPAP